jgi:hypothetical protein
MAAREGIREHDAPDRVTQEIAAFADVPAPVPGSGGAAANSLVGRSEAGDHLHARPGALDRCVLFINEPIA